MPPDVGGQLLLFGSNSPSSVKYLSPEFVCLLRPLFLWCFPAQWSLAHQNITAFTGPRSPHTQPETWESWMFLQCSCLSFLTCTSRVLEGRVPGAGKPQEAVAPGQCLCSLPPPPPPPPHPCLGLSRKEARCCQDVSLPPPSVTPCGLRKVHLVLLTQTLLGMSLGTTNWMEVHGSQGMCLSPPAPSPVPAAGSPGTGWDWPGLALGEGQGW